MKEPSSRGRTCAAIIFSVLIALVTAALLLLGKHTLPGWGLAAAVFCAFFFLRRRLKGKCAAVRLCAWAALLLLLAGALRVSLPPRFPPWRGSTAASPRP